MVASYHHPGLQFFYPDNWTITDESLADWPRTVSVQSPGSGFWTVVQYELGTTPQTLLEQTLRQMQEEYESVESATIVDQFEAVQATGFELFFYCFDFLICARILTARAADGSVLLILWQAEDREFAEAELVFRAITTSLLRGAAAGE